MMVPDTRQRLESAVGDLQIFLVSSWHPEHDADPRPTVMQACLGVHPCFLHMPPAMHSSLIAVEVQSRRGR